jgi:pimeloyl-ACP methyl ester carboxylesterase
MARFVLVHGAFHGGWCWKRVTARLRAAGHEVWAPSLTGLGERAHLATPETGLHTHVQDICALIEAEELDDVVLVGHSYGGMVITGVGEKMPARLRHLVYLDAMLPKHGESALDKIGADFSARLKTRMEQGDGPRPGVPAADFFGVFDPDDVAWLNRQLRPHPRKAYTERHEGPDNRVAAIPRTYVYCDNPAMGLFDAAAKLRADPRWRFHVLHTGHDAMVSDPDGVAGILLRDLEPAA